MRANSLMATGENLTEILGYALAGFTARLGRNRDRLPHRQPHVLSSRPWPCSRCAITRRCARRSRKAQRSFWHELREGLRYVRAAPRSAREHGDGDGLRRRNRRVLPLTFLLAVRVLDGGAKAFGTFRGSHSRRIPGGLPGHGDVGYPHPQGVRHDHRTGGHGREPCHWSLPPAACGRPASPSLSLGLANAAALIAIDTYLQQAVPEHLRGRVFGVRFTLTQGTMRCPC